MAASQDDSDDFISSINVTPLVDVLLVMLIVMMVTASYVVTRSMRIDLPHGATGEDNATALTLSVDERGRLELEGRRTDEAALKQRVRALRARSGVRVLIAADASTPHRHVVRLMDVLRQVEVHRIAIGVRAEQP